MNTSHQTSSSFREPPAPEAEDWSVFHGGARESLNAAKPTELTFKETGSLQRGGGFRGLSDLEIVGLGGRRTLVFFL